MQSSRQGAAGQSYRKLGDWLVEWGCSVPTQTNAYVSHRSVHSGVPQQITRLKMQQIARADTQG